MKKINIELIKENPDNPRYIRDSKFAKLVKSIKEFPEMLEKRPLVVDENMIVLGGNMRLKALQEAGIKQVWVSIAENWTQEQKKEFIVKDNIGYGEWDWEILANDWDTEKLSDWGLDIPNYDQDLNLDDFFEEDEKKDEDEKEDELEWYSRYVEFIAKEDSFLHNKASKFADNNA